MKKYLSLRSHELLPRNCWKLVFLASEGLGIFSKIYPELFPASSGAQLQENAVSTFLSNWVKYDYNLRSDNRSKKTFFSIRWSIVTQLDRKSADGDFLQLGRWRSWKQLWTDLGETSQVILRRGRPNSNIFGANIHANVLKGTFSTDCKSNCIRIGLQVIVAEECWPNLNFVYGKCMSTKDTVAVAKTSDS